MAAEKTTNVTDVPDRSRYEIQLGGDLAGFVEYHRRPGLTSLVHTEIDDRFEGQGLGGKLVRAALDDLRERGDQLLPFCPFVNGWVQRHREYADLVPEQLRARFDL